MKKQSIYIALAFVLILCLAVFCVAAKYDYNIMRITRIYAHSITTEGASIMNPTSVSITAASPTFAASGLSHVRLSSDAATTNTQITGGTNGQILYVRTGPVGSDTIRFDDDGLTMALGGNITLTEGEGDTLTLISTGSGSWSRLANGDN